MMQGETDAGPAANGVVNRGQHGLDCADGIATLSVLRSAAYCHEQGQSLDELQATRFMDQGEHEFRLLVTAGEPDEVRELLPALADWLDAPPVVYAHLPLHLGSGEQSETASASQQELLMISPSTVRMTACKRSTDGEALVVRLHETRGVATSAVLMIQSSPAKFELLMRPFEITTVRIERDGRYDLVDMIEES